MPGVRPLVAAALLAITCVVIVRMLLQHPEVIPPRDFVEYWAAARVALDGGDPYDADQLLPLQQWAANEPDRTEAVMMWNPPWTLPICLPFALLDPRPAQLLWMTFQAALIVVSGVLSWRLYRGPHAHPVAVALIAGLFFATVWTILYGQNTGLLLFGLAGFAYFNGRNRPVLAGTCAALTALKPHLLAVFGVLLVLNAFSPRGRRTLLAGAGVIAVAMVVALLVDHDVLGQYVRALSGSDARGTSTSLSNWRVPLAAFYLRIALDDRQFWIQFVPCVLACMSYAVYFGLRRSTWDWTTQLPGVIWVSVTTAPYGGWIFDLIVLLLPVMQAATWLANQGTASTIRLFAACHVVLTGCTFVFAKWLDDFWWLAPATLALYAAAWKATAGSRLK